MRSQLRFIHFSDLHLGVESYGRTDSQTGHSTRLLDFLKAFDTLVDYAVGERLDLVLFAGDAYKSREPSQTHQREFARRIRRLVEAGIPVFLLVGNHDLPSATHRASALDIYDTLGVPRVTVGDDLQTYRLEIAAGPVQVVALPWPNVSKFATREHARGKTLDQLHAEVAGALNDKLWELAEGLDPELPCLCIGHITVDASGIRRGSERGMILGWDPYVLRSSFRRGDFDYVALGHLHPAQQVAHEPPIVYSGSMQPIDFGEEGQEKGFYLVTLDLAKPRGQRAVEIQFRPVPARRFVTVRARPRNSDPTGEVVAAIRKADVEDAVVRVFVELTAEQEALLREAEARAALMPAHYLAGISREVAGRRRSRLPEGVSLEGASPLRALEVYLQQAAVPPDRRAKLLQRARRLMGLDAHEEQAEVGRP